MPARAPPGRAARRHAETDACAPASRSSNAAPGNGGRLGGGVAAPRVGPQRVAARPRSVLEMRGLCVDYGLGDDAVHAVVGADLKLRRGEVLGLAGESGSGKSTLAYAVTRLLRPPGVITAGVAAFR